LITLSTKITKHNQNPPVKAQVSVSIENVCKATNISSTLMAMKQSMTLPSLAAGAERPLDIICLGRAGVDLYAREHDTGFSAVSGFDKYVGGSPANIAAAIAKQGGKAGFIGCVSDDGLGRYVCDYLRGLGVDLSGMKTLAGGTRTSLAITEMRAAQPEVVIYRNHAADLALQPADIDPGYIAKARMLLVSGTALSASPSREATLLAMAYARQHGTLVVLDMDYRAYSWESREAPALYYNIAAGHSHIMIGNREEFEVLAYSAEQGTDDAQLARHYLREPTAIMIIKEGAAGSTTYTPGGSFRQGIFPVDVQKPFGAGDAFAGTLMLALLRDYSLPDAVAMGSAAAAINVSRSSCSEAMPTTTELTEFMRGRDYQLSEQDKTHG
jgi:5-dehydro-2-deoxygluconokinase